MLRIFLLTGSLVTLLSLNLGVAGYSDKCKDMDLKMTEEEMMHMKDCLKAIGVPSFKEINAGNVGCYTKCCMDKMGLVDTAGKAHKENINKAIGALWPDEGLRNAMQVGIGKCLDNEGSHLKIEDDAKCSSFEPLSACMHTTFMTVCT